jgi:hypothetical protein
MLKRLLTGASLALALACVAPKPKPPVVVPPPQNVHITAHVFDGDPAKDSKVEGAQVRVEGCESLACLWTADGAGNALLTLPAGSYRLCGAFKGYAEACVDATAPGSVNIVLERLIPPTLQVRVDGRFWVTDAGVFRPVFASDLAALPLSAEAQVAKLDETQALGFNGVRVFAGDLGWAGQTPAKAREALPIFLKAAQDRGLYVYVCALTGGGYDVAAHLRDVAGIVAQFPNALLEVANEIGHASQSDFGKDPARLLDLAKRSIPAGVTWTLGAPVHTDEPTPEGTYPTDGGQFNDGHLDRGRERWNQVRRLREIYAISEVTRKPAMSGEPIGSAEVDRPGSRLHDPEFYFAMGVLCRGFELGCVFHSEDGLFGRPLGPNQTEDAKSFIAGTKTIPTGDRLEFRNAGWANSPVESANFDNGIVRVYSFLAGDKGWTVLLGITGDPRLKLREGWRVVGVVAERPGVQVLEISR